MTNYVEDIKQHAFRSWDDSSPEYQKIVARLPEWAKWAQMTVAQIRQELSIRKIPGRTGWVRTGYLSLLIIDDLKKTLELPSSWYSHSPWKEQGVSEAKGHAYTYVEHFLNEICEELKYY